MVREGGSEGDLSVARDRGLGETNLAVARTGAAC